jgi:hypothetical protein
MPIRVSCPNCDKAYRVPDANAGKRGRCKACGAIMAIPESDVSPFELSDLASSSHETPVADPPVAATGHQSIVCPVCDGTFEQSWMDANGLCVPCAARSARGAGKRSTKQRTGWSPKRALVLGMGVIAVIVAVVLVYDAALIKPVNRSTLEDNKKVQDNWDRVIGDLRQQEAAARSSAADAPPPSIKPTPSPSRERPTNTKTWAQRVDDDAVLQLIIRRVPEIERPLKKRDHAGVSVKVTLMLTTEQISYDEARYINDFMAQK